LQIKGSSEATKNFLSEFEEAKDSSIFLQPAMAETTNKIEFKGTIDLVDISANHSGEESFELKSISLAIEEGEFLAIVGPSGSGKSTLVDVMLGIITPTNGYSTISGVQPALAMRIWPDKIRYVPQDIQLVSGSILENIIWPDPEASLNAVELQRLLEIVELDEWINSLECGLNTRINSLGSNLSGGQRQRIGIARALYASPQILFLDESTSALDAQTEKEIIDRVVGKMSALTRIVISHRVSTIRDADKIVYIEKGSIRAVGKYSELVAQLPSFGVEHNFE
jgi:ABC-type bacteriocin/lantibiotic exporter with double-glycine peptidase domain